MILKSPQRGPGSPATCMSPCVKVFFGVPATCSDCSSFLHATATGPDSWGRGQGICLRYAGPLTGSYGTPKLFFSHQYCRVYLINGPFPRHSLLSILFLSYHLTLSHALLHMHSLPSNPHQATLALVLLLVLPPILRTPFIDELCDFYLFS